MPYENNGVYEFVCRTCSTSVTVILKDFRFEILFETGLNAILDNYNREAVSSFAASLERFYELFARLVARRFKIAESEHEKCWKLVAKQSERQVGVFLASYLLLFKETPLMLSDLSAKKMDFEELRNHVVHKGKYPSRIEAIEYGEAVATVIEKAIVKFFEEDFDSGVQIIAAVRNADCDRIKERIENKNLATVSRAGYLFPSWLPRKKRIPVSDWVASRGG